MTDWERLQSLPDAYFDAIMLVSKGIMQTFEPLSACNEPRKAEARRVFDNVRRYLYEQQFGRKAPWASCKPLPKTYCFECDERWNNCQCDRFNAREV
jgi:hypothetical protein